MSWESPPFGYRPYAICYIEAIESNDPPLQKPATLPYCVTVHLCEANRVRRDPQVKDQ